MPACGVVVAVGAILAGCGSDTDVTGIRPYDPAGSSVDTPGLPAYADPSARAAGAGPVPPDVPQVRIPDRTGLSALDGALPPELVGTWESLGQSSVVSYRFDEDGLFGSAALLWQERSTGTWWYEVTTAGTATVTGDVLVLEATTGRHRMTDPDDPGENWDRPLLAEASERTWEIRDGGTVLVLTDEHGATEFRLGGQE